MITVKAASCSRPENIAIREESDRTLLSSGFSQTVTESVLPVTTNGQAGGAAAECLIFPTLSGTTEGLKIKVATKGTNSADRTDTYEIRVPVVGDDGGRKDENGKTVTEPFRFLPNYSIRLPLRLLIATYRLLPSSPPV